MYSSKDYTKYLFLLSLFIGLSIRMYQTSRSLIVDPTSIHLFLPSFDVGRRPPYLFLGRESCRVWTKESRVWAGEKKKKN